MSRVAIVAILLCSMIWELTDPSTNFIRVGVAARSKPLHVISQALPKKGPSTVCTLNDGGDPVRFIDCRIDSPPVNPDHTSPFDDATVCYATLPEQVPLFILTYTRVPRASEARALLATFVEDIFQPPRA